MLLPENRLCEAIAKVCPLDGLAIGTWDDRGTWRLDYAAGATDVQKANAIELMNAFDFNAPVVDQVNTERDRRLKRFTFEGREFDFCDGRGSDQNIAGAATLALAAVLTAEGVLSADSKDFTNASRAGTAERFAVVPQADQRDRAPHR